MAVPQKCAFIGLPNMAQRNLFNVASARGGNTTYDSSTLPVSRLLTQEPTEVARVLTLDPAWAGFQFSFGGNTKNTTVDGVALVNSNISPWGYWRVVELNGSLSHQNAAPTSIASSSNLTGTISNVNMATAGSDITVSPWGAHPYTTGQNVGSAAAFDVRYSWAGVNWSGLFALPASNHAQTGAHMAQFVMRAYLGAALPVAGYSVVYPTVRCELWENGAFKRILGRRAITANNQILIFDFDPAEVSDFTKVECKLFFATGTVGVGNVGVGEIALYFSLIANGFTPTVDSGWQESPISGETPDSDTPAPSVSFHYLAPLGTTILGAGGLGAELLILDDQTPHSPDYRASDGAVWSSEIPVFPAGYIEAGVLVLGDSYRLSKGWKPPGPSTSIVIEEQSGNSSSGQAYGADSFRKRLIKGGFFLTRDEELFLTDHLDWRRGYSAPFYLVSDPDLPSEYQLFRGIYCTVKSAGESSPVDMEYAPDNTMQFTKDYEFLERL